MAPACCSWGRRRGKSSTALICAEAGFDYVADDYCLVTPEPFPTALGLYAAPGKVLHADLPLYPAPGRCHSARAPPTTRCC